MLAAFITSRKEAFTAQLHPSDTIQSLLKALLSLDVFSTAILLFTEGQEEDSFREKPLISLFIFQNLPYAVYRFTNDRLEILRFSDYFKALSRTSGRLSLYPVTPVLFKSLLIVAETDAVMRGTSDVIDNERLIRRIEESKEESVLTLTAIEEKALYYFREGKLQDAYFESHDQPQSPESLRKKLLLQSDFSGGELAELMLYRASGMSGAEDQDKACAQIEASSPIEGEVWERISSDPAGETAWEWGIEYLNGDKAGKIAAITQETCSLGRGKVDLKLDDPQVSRHHADLKLSQEGLTLMDRKSTNGLFVNNQQITEKSLSAGDLIHLGDSTLKVVQQSGGLKT